MRVCRDESERKKAITYSLPKRQRELINEFARMRGGGSRSKVVEDALDSYFRPFIDNGMLDVRTSA